MYANAKKVFVAMSGGVDSSVAAALLKKRGFDVAGVFMKNWSEGDYCTAQIDEADVRKACATLNIPFYTFNFEKEYRKNVFNYFIEGYKKGITPNPDCLCNTEIKFGIFLKKALKLGADYIATGHYVKKLKTQNSKLVYKLIRAKDLHKDQSYFLYGLRQKQIAQAFFPIGNYLKSEVREMAKKFGLPNWNKKDSQGLCFVGKVAASEFLKRYLPIAQGDIFTIGGRKIGQHQGAYYFTIGQRHGLGIGGGVPYYVVRKDIKNNTLTVAAGESAQELYSKEVVVGNINWVEGSAPKTQVSVRAKYRHPQAQTVRCNISSCKSGKILVCFKKPQRALAPGQIIVFYKKSEMLGGGEILSSK